MIMSKSNDLLWKGVLEDVFEDFLSFLYPDAAELFDFDRGFEFLDKELEQVFPPEGGEYAPKLVDMLVKVHTKGGKEEWILVHVEVQGRYHKDFSKRMFTYYYRILDKYDKPVTAVAVFTEANTLLRSDRFELEYLGTRLGYTFNTYKIAEEDEGTLLASDNIFALVVLAARSAFKQDIGMTKTERDQQLLKFKTLLLKRLYSKEFEGKKVNALMNFLRYYVRFETEDSHTQFEQKIKTITKNTTMGIEELLLEIATSEGIQKGIKQGLKQGVKKGVRIEQEKLVKNLICKSGMTDGQIVDVAGVSALLVERIRTKIRKETSMVQ